MSIMDQRQEAVAETIGKVRAIEHAHGVTPAALDRIKPVLVELASRTELFPREQFGVPEGTARANLPPGRGRRPPIRALRLGGPAVVGAGDSK
ncbi:MAG: hypothetical protein HC871_13900 [Rhizobiales bacterium]|nr:hypothetical protein [Hyphomicrobiales bacterium]